MTTICQFTLVNKVNCAVCWRLTAASEHTQRNTVNPFKV